MRLALLTSRDVKALEDAFAMIDSEWGFNDPDNEGSYRRSGPDWYVALIPLAARLGIVFPPRKQAHD
jgi:hypothetical protein